MSQGRMLQRTVILLAAVSAIALFTAGCDCPKKVEALQKDNQALNQRISELETQVQQKDMALAQAQAVQVQAAVQPQPVQIPVKDTIPTAAPATAIQPQTTQVVYVVKEGDNLWKIARKQLGNGARYKEIMDLNPAISTDKPLLVGTKLTIPAR